MIDLHRPAPCRPARARLAAVSLLLLGVLLTGCFESTPSSRRTRFSAASTQTSQTHLQSGIEFLDRMDEFQQDEAAAQVSYHLNRWLKAQDVSADWSPTPLIRRLPRDVREDASFGELARMRFDQADIEALMQADLMNDITRWVASAPVASPLAEWYAPEADALPDLQRDQLKAAVRLFDWTVRNVQLDETLPYPTTIVAPTTDNVTTKRPPPPPQRGVPGPGYQFAPWQTLTFGHGDAVARARVFLALTRQQGLDGVMLAFPGQTIPPRPVPWLPAVLIGGKLYLFDAELGLPIPSRRGTGIATLDEVIEDPEVLASLSIDDEHAYRVGPSDLKTVIALLDATPAELSRRMELLEEQLTGDQRMVLTAPTTELAERLKSCPGIDDVVLWPISVETAWYQTAFQKRLTDMRGASPAEQEAIREFISRHAPLMIRNPLVRARRLHFRQQFENEDGTKGAKTLYSESRVPQVAISELESSSKVQQRMGLQRSEDESELLWRSRLASSRELMQTSKEHASYWLGLAQYDSGRPEAAVEWFARRTLEATPDTPWAAGARYNLARTYEALGDYDQALDLYYEDDSIQQHGNLLRARFLNRALRRPAESP